MQGPKFCMEINTKCLFVYVHEEITYFDRIKCFALATDVEVWILFYSA
jgi:hypothetical protein